MATQTVEFIGPPGATITSKLFSAGSDTQVDSASATEATNRKGIYTADYTDLSAGEYLLVATDASNNPLAHWWVATTGATETVQAYEIGIETIQEGLATQASVDDLTTTVVEGTPQNETAVSATVTAGTVASGTVADTETDNGTYYQLVPDAGGIDAYLEFQIANRFPNSVTMNGKFNATNASDFVEVYAYNWESAAWEKISDVDSRLNHSTSDQNYAYPLTTKNRNGAGSNGEVRIRFLTAETDTGFDLDLDQVLVQSVAAAATAAEIADAVRQRQIENTYGGGVTIDTVAGSAGTDLGDFGTPQSPSSNLSDAYTIATNSRLNFNTFYMTSGSSVTLDASDYTNWNFEGSPSLWTVALGGRTLTGTSITSSRVSGIMINTGNRTRFRDCVCFAVTLGNSVWYDSVLTENTITLQDGASVSFRDCESAADQAVPTINFSTPSTNTAVDLPDFHGLLAFDNMNASSVVSIFGVASVTINASCTAGTMQVGPDVEVTNNGSVTVTRINSQSTLADGAIDDDTITAAAVTKIQSGLATEAKQDIIDGLIDTLVSATIIGSGTMQAGSTSTTAVLAAATTFADDLLNNGSAIVITGGTGQGQVRLITDWVSSSDTATVAAWTTTPDNTSTYVVVPIASYYALQSYNAGAGAGPYILLDTTVSSVSSTTTFVLNGGLGTDDYYNDKRIVIVDNDDNTVRWLGEVSDYVGSTKTLTVASTPVFTVAADDRVYVLALTDFDPESDGVIVGSLTTSAINSLANAEIEVVGAMLPGGRIQLIKGDDYINDELTFTQTASEDWPDLTTATVTFEAMLATESDPESPTGDTIDIEGTKPTPAGSAKVIKFNAMTRTITDIATGTYTYHIRATQADGTVQTLRYGESKLTIKPQYVVPDA